MYTGSWVGTSLRHKFPSACNRNVRAWISLPALDPPCRYEGKVVHNTATSRLDYSIEEIRRKLEFQVTLRSLACHPPVLDRGNFWMLTSLSTVVHPSQIWWDLIFFVAQRNLSFSRRTHMVNGIGEFLCVFIKIPQPCVLFFCE